VDDEEESDAMEPIDFRSDTVTLPSPEMREAMAAAALGDDVYGEDPTVKALEARAAELLGKEAALYVPTGTMGNLLAVMTHCQPGDELICGKRTHTYAAEGGGPARLCGVSTWTVSQDRGRLDPAEVAAGIHPDNEHLPRTSLLIVEQPHGGWVMPLDNMKAVISIAREHGLKVHMDGARVFNAATALGIPASELASHVDTVMFCISKGLAAPVGSMLVGSKEFIKRAHRNRKAVGGGMRQAGVIAAAGLLALQHGVARLADDHANARLLAEGLEATGRLTADPSRVETNIVIAELARDGDDAGALARELAAVGVLTAALDWRRLRFVTSSEVDEAGVRAALSAAGPVLR
jgi:threonine aldolase